LTTYLGDDFQNRFTSFGNLVFVHQGDVLLGQLEEHIVQHWLGKAERQRFDFLKHPGHTDPRGEIPNLIRQ
jgi:hypothetical protein